MPTIPKNHGKEWTDSSISDLKKLAKGNTPTELVAYKLGRTVDSVRTEASKENISLKPTNQSPYDRKVSDAKKGKK
jgi:hypothetical protein